MSTRLVNPRHTLGVYPQRPEPDWYKDACVQQARALAEEATAEAVRLQREVNEINTKLAELGIVPITPAHLTDIGAYQVPALLLEADPDGKRRSVWAGHDSHRVVVLVGIGAETAPVYSRPLTCPRDVVDARRDGAAFHPRPLDHKDMAESILRGGLPERGEVPARTYHELRAIHGVIAALLALTDSPAR